MIKFCVGDLVVLKRDCNSCKRVFIVLAVSEIYDSLKLVDYKSYLSHLRSYSVPFWWPCGSFRKVSFYQPELISGVD